MNQPSITSDKGRLLLIGMPIGFAVLLTISASALFVAGWVGRAPDGLRVALALQSSCPEAWADLLSARGESVGLGDPVVSETDGLLRYESTFPGLAGDIEAMPKLLTGGGKLGVYAVPEVDAVEGIPEGPSLASEADVTEVSVGLSMMGRARVTLTLTEAAAERMAAATPPLLIVLDGTPIEALIDPRGFAGNELLLQPERAEFEEEIHVATDWGILLRHGSAPCEVDALEVVPL